MSSTQGELLDHSYDGIQEYDNPTPGWWHLIFWVTILFSALYGSFFHFSPMAWDEKEVLTQDQTEYYAKLFGSVGSLEGDEPTVLRMMGEPKWLKVGQAVFAGNCTPCHGPDGGGINGPNMTDDYYKNIKQLGDLYRVISDGVVEKGMPAWKNRLQQNQRVVVAAYVATLRGTKVPGGRAPEGDVIPPWPPVPAAAAPGAGGSAAVPKPK